MCVQTKSLYRTPDARLHIHDNHHTDIDIPYCKGGSNKHFEVISRGVSQI